jgi:hypothetical protein
MAGEWGELVRSLVDTSSETASWEQPLKTVAPHSSTHRRAPLAVDPAAAAGEPFLGSLAGLLLGLEFFGENSRINLRQPGRQ